MELDKIINENCLSGLKNIPDNSIDCCVTSPPYWGLRDYGTAKWIGGDENCDHIADATKTKKFGNEEFNENRPSREETKTKGYYENICPKCGAKREDEQLGLEKTPEEYVTKLADIFDEVKRRMKDDATLWLNLGDSYAGSGKGDGGKTRKQTTNAGSQFKSDLQGIVPVGLKPKDLVGIPWMVAFELRRRGWYLRQDIIWAKPNPMPESVTDRCTKAHEYIFLLSKSSKYYYDNEAIKTKMADSSIQRVSQDLENQAGSDRVPGKTNGPMKAKRPNGITRDRLLDYNSKEKLLRPDVKRGEFEKESDLVLPEAVANKRSVWTVTTKPFSEAHFATFPEDLIVDCIKAGCPPDGVVLDPFMGAGTTALVASKLGRHYLGFELNPDYIKIAQKRLFDQIGLFL